MATKQVIFKLGEEEYGMDIMLVNAIENYTGVVPIPNAPAYILGILNLRGEVIPVYSLRKKFGMPETSATESTQLLITRADGTAIGYKVDSVSEIMEVADSEMQEIPVIVKNVDTRYALGVANKKNRMIVLLDNANILSEQESEVVRRVSEDATLN